MPHYWVKIFVSLFSSVPLLCIPLTVGRKSREQKPTIKDIYLYMTYQAG